MSVESPSLFAKAIQEHLELKQRNATLDPQMPLHGYKSEDPFENHPLFKTEEQARIEETMDGQPAVVAAGPWPGEDSATVENAHATHRNSRTASGVASRATSTGATRASPKVLCTLGEKTLAGALRARANLVRLGARGCGPL
jgi:hypothetical protein